MPHGVAERLRPVRAHPWIGYVAGLAVFAVGFTLRYAAGAALDAVPFITLFPAILVAALIGGLRVGLVVAVLSFFSGWFFFSCRPAAPGRFAMAIRSPHWSFSVSRPESSFT